MASNGKRLGDLELKIKLSAKALQSLRGRVRDVKPESSTSYRSSHASGRSTNGWRDIIIPGKRRNLIREGGTGTEDTAVVVLD